MNESMTYVPASSLGWLDLDAAASEHVSTLLRALEEPGTLDPLGLGSVRDGFADILHPGTSTIQTRLRYFVFLPWIFLDMEARGVRPERFAAELKDREVRLIDCLRSIGPDQGVIGFTAGRDLKRFPSAVYWGGLGSWGIRRLDLSLGEYARYAPMIGRRRAHRDDDGNPTAAAPPMWAALPSAPERFLHEPLTFELQRDEARVLVDHIQGHHPGSLLAALCRTPELAATADHPWDLPAAALPGRLGDVVRHARCLSELTVGPQLVYNMLLARRAQRELGWDTSELEHRQLEALARWADGVQRRHAELRQWVDELPACWSLLAAHGAVREATRDFVCAMVSRAVQDPVTFAEDDVVHARVRQRELQLKGRRARLGPRAALESWNGAPFGGQLTYRWPVARRYLGDIAQALGGRA